MYLGFRGGGRVKELGKILLSIPDHMYYFHWETKTVKFAKTTLYHVSNTHMMLNRSALKKILEGNIVAQCWL